MTKLLSFICFILILLPSFSLLAIAETNDFEVEVNEPGLFINLKAARFDPLAGSPGIPSELTYRTENNYYLVQARGPLAPEWIEDLLGAGAHIMGYVPEYTYILFMENHVKSNVEQFSFIRWIGTYHPAYKLDQGLNAREGTVQLNVVVFDKGGGHDNIDLVKNMLRDFGGNIIRDESIARTLVVEIDASMIINIAFIPEVEWVDEYFEPVALMDNIRMFTGAESPVHENGFNGTGIVGEVKDNGIDADHLEFTGRLIGTDGNVNEDSHGTSTFGIVFARGANERAQGMLPGGQGVFAAWNVGRKQSIANLVNNWGGSFQSNSWSSGSNDGSYGSNSRENDDAVFVYDTTMLYSTGNGGYDEAITQEAASKNVIGVGGTNHYNNQDRTDDRHNGNQGNKGPTADGRVKPDVVGPYDSIYTTTTQDRYTSGFGGTSGAAPVVAGGVGLIYQMYRENHFFNNPSGIMPHASTVKALLIADAYQYEMSQADRYAQGWGLVDVGNIYNIGKNHLIENEDVTLQTGDSKSYRIQPTTATPLKITLVWTDVPGTTSSSMHLINDLNLKVTDPLGNTYMGNYGLESSKWSESGGDFDGLNNVENVFIETPISGEWTIEVIGENIPMDGVPATQKVDQHYALVASGVTRYEHDLKIKSLDFPKMVATGEKVIINSTVMNIGSNDAVDVKVRLAVDNETVETKAVDLIEIGDTIKMDFVWVPALEKQYFISVSVEPLSGEISTWDNNLSGSLRANFVTGLVLVDDGHGTDVDHELYYYYLETEGPEKYRVHHATGTITTPLLSKYDVFISVSPTEAYTPQEVASIQDFMSAGGGILVIGEADQAVYNDLTDYAGITWGNQYLIQYNGETTDINEHEITDNIDTLYFDSPQVPLETVAPAEEIVYTNGGVVSNRLTVVVSEYGQGKMVAIADTDCLNSQFIGQFDNKLFGINIIKWLTNARPFSVIDSPLNNSKYSLGENILFDGRSSYDPEGAVLSFEWRSDLDGVIGTGADFNTTLSAGRHNITLRVSDTGDKFDEAKVMLRVVAPPNTEILYPVNSELIHGTILVTGTAYDPDGTVGSVELKLDNRKWQETVDTSSVNDWSAWTFELESAEIADGAHNIYVRARDNDGFNSSEKSVTINIDNTEPTIIIGPFVTSLSDTQATIEWETDEPASGIVEYGTDRSYGGRVSSDGSFVTLHVFILSGLDPQTTYYYRASSVDETGNDPVVSDDLTFKTLRPPDSTPPSVDITSPSEGAVLTGTVAIMADISDDQEVTEVELYIDGELVYIDNILEFFWLWDTADDYYPDGQYTIRISATDWNGNSAGDEINVELDNEVIPPIIEAEDVTPGSVNAGETTEVLFVVEITDVENVLEFVIIDLSQLGGPSEQLMYDDGTHGDKIPGDNIFSFEQEVSSEVLQGEKSMPVRLTYAEEESVDTSLILYVTLSETGEGQETGRDNDLDKLLPWLILVGAALIIVVVTAYLFSLNRRLVYHYEEALEVEPIYYYDQ